jgi:hypothetical protein
LRINIVPNPSAIISVAQNDVNQADFRGVKRLPTTWQKVGVHSQRIAFALDIDTIIAVCSDDLQNAFMHTHPGNK